MTLLLSLAFLSLGATCVTSDRSPVISVMEEAEHIVIDSLNTLLADPVTVEFIAASVTTIRANFPQVSKVRNTGARLLGALRVYDYSLEVHLRIHESQYGPVKTAIAIDSRSALVVFAQPYNPGLLSSHLNRECGIRTWPAYLEGPDYGRIIYDSKRVALTFREGLQNCGPCCAFHNSWIFVYGKSNNTWSLDVEFHTGIPQQHTTTTTTAAPPTPCYGK